MDFLWHAMWCSRCSQHVKVACEVCTVYRNLCSGMPNTFNHVEKLAKFRSPFYTTAPGFNILETPVNSSIPLRRCTSSAQNLGRANGTWMWAWVLKSSSRTKYTCSTQMSSRYAKTFSSPLNHSCIDNGTVLLQCEQHGHEAVALLSTFPLWDVLGARCSRKCTQSCGRHSHEFP